MQVASGTRLGPYEIVAPIGAGGMGEVYRARDTRLDRSVAIKILPAGFAANPQVRLRFEREAKSISQLNHPHICTLYDVGHESGTDYLVMELLEGESLADRLGRGPLPLSDVLRAGIQIADALAQAHRQGIVHRDLKPGNIILTTRGAKLLDFGLAKNQPSVLGPRALETATEHKPLTQEGTIVGTFQYMAPEQLEGLEADARTDIFAFGGMLYEMVTGRRAFEGATKTSLIAAIVDRDPRPMAELQPLTPPALEHVVGRCLRKHPDERWQSALDVASELRWISEAGSQAGVAAPLTRRRRTRESLSWILVAILSLAVAGVAAWAFRERSRRVAPQVMRFDLNVSPPLAFVAFSRALAISPDGRRVAYASSEGDITRIAVRNLERLETVSLSGTEGGRWPFFSPDGEWIAFFAGGQLKKVPAAGGPVQLICSQPGEDGHWESDDTILFCSSGGIHRVPASGGIAELILPVNARDGHAAYAVPSLLPGGRSLLLTIVSSANNALEQTIAVYDLDRRAMRVLRAGTNAHYLPTGHILFAANGNLYVVTFDPKTLHAGTNPIAVLEGVATNSASGVAHFDASTTGSLVYVSGGVKAADTRLAWADRKGMVQPILLPPRPYEHPRISPDGRRVVVAVRETETDVWSYDLERGTLSRLTFTPSENEAPIWSPDGRRVIFSTTRVNMPRAHLAKAADGTGSEDMLLKADVHQHVSSISPDGKMMTITEYGTSNGSDLWLAPLDGSGKPRVLVKTPFDERAACFSPDGRWITYSSNESGRTEIFVLAANGSGKWQISTSGGFAPIWSRNGRELYYRAGNDLMVADVTSTPSSFSASVPRLLFTAEFHNLSRGEANYDVSPDGRRFIIVQREKEAKPPPVLLVANWFEELRRIARQ